MILNEILMRISIHPKQQQSPEQKYRIKNSDEFFLLNPEKFFTARLWFSELSLRFPFPWLIVVAALGSFLPPSLRPLRVINNWERRSGPNVISFKAKSESASARSSFACQNICHEASAKKCLLTSSSPCSHAPTFGISHNEFGLRAN